MRTLWTCLTVACITLIDLDAGSAFLYSARIRSRSWTKQKYISVSLRKESAKHGPGGGWPGVCSGMRSGGRGDQPIIFGPSMAPREARASKLKMTHGTLDYVLDDAPPIEADEKFAEAIDTYRGIRSAQKERGGEAGGKEEDEAMVKGLRLLEEVFQMDWEWAHSRLYGNGPGVIGVKNVTCMRPQQVSKQLDVVAMDDELLDFVLEEGRVCDKGRCCDACSRVTIPRIASGKECKAFIASIAALMPPLGQPTEGDKLQQNLGIALTAASGELETQLCYIRLVERLRRVISFEYGLPLACLSPRQTFVSRIQGSMAASEYSQIHADECSTSSYHYSAVLYLSERRYFTGGDFVFTDPPTEDGSGRVLTRIAPQQGQAVIFSSGWENYHYVDSLSGGVRYAVPTFFTTLRPIDVGGELKRPWRAGDALGRARALYENGLLPSTLNGFLNFKQRWGEMFGPDAV